MSSHFSKPAVLEINWTAGPDDATHYLPDSEENHELFLKVSEGRTLQYAYAHDLLEGDKTWSPPIEDPWYYDDVLAEPTLVAKNV